MDIILNLLPLPVEIIAIIASFNIQKLSKTDERYRLLKSHFAYYNYRNYTITYFPDMRERGILIDLRTKGFRLLRCNIRGDFVYTFCNETSRRGSVYWNQKLVIN